MTNLGKWLVVSVVAVIAMTVAPKQAKADDCMEVGWKLKDGNWTYYRAWVDAEDGNKLHMHYDYHHGKLELKVFEKEKGDGEDVIVMRGRWYEGRDAQRSGKVRLQLEKGHHRAKGWYTYGDDEGAEHFDFAMRDCKRGRH